MVVHDLQRIRNVAIIAHVDHGKSTLADRFIQRCGGLSAREMSAQVLDSMDLERERGITIKAQSVSLSYKSAGGIEYQLNFIDTPGHVDFSYEVSRSLTACDGAILVVDASQGVEAQTVANCHTAVDLGLELLPVINKIDLPAADPQRVTAEIENIIGIDCSHAVFCSAKTGQGIDEVLEAIVKYMPSPVGNRRESLKALILDSWFDNYLGTVSLLRLFDGRLKARDRITMIASGRNYVVEQIGIFTPKRTKVTELRAGEVGYLIAGVKDVKGARVGDTVTSTDSPTTAPLEGFREISPRVFAGLFLVNSGEYESFREALERLSLNDASLHYEPETSEALGYGFRCGFLGMLHMEIIQERLEREYGIELITTAPTVAYEVVTMSGRRCMIDRPSQLPAPSEIKQVREPIVETRMLMPHEYVGTVITMCINKRGMQRDIRYLGRQVMLIFDLPLIEVVLDFFDKLKSVSRGYASLDFEFKEFRPADMCKLDFMINGDKVDSLSILIHRQQAQFRGRELVKRMRDLIPRQMFDVAVQAAVGSRIVARETIRAMRKNVTAKCYGGDVSRKRKLLEKQKKGKQKMKKIGSVEIPQEAFMAVLRVEAK